MDAVKNGMQPVVATKCLMRAWEVHEVELRTWLLHRLGDRSEADDLLQEVFIKAYRQGERFCSIRNGRAWLFEIARNALADRHKARWSRMREDLPDDLTVEPESSPTVDALAECLPRVLSELSEEDSESIRLCDIDGMSQQEYARLKGLTLPGAKSRVQRARTRMRAHLIKACQVRFDEAGLVCCFVPRPPVRSD